MTSEEKQLLLKALCEGLPYGVKVYLKQTGSNQKEYSEIELIPEYIYTIGTSIIKPYLRPMSSMTKEEKKEFDNLMNLVEERCINAYGKGGYTLAFTDLNDWLNAYHFDYRGLIPMGLALEAKEDIYKIE